jgi:hypothetical protein
MNASELTLGDPEHVGMRSVQDIGQLEPQRRRLRRFLFLAASISGSAPQHQQHCPAREVVRSKYDDRVIGELAIGYDAIRLVLLYRKIIPQRVCCGDNRFVARSGAIARPDHIDLNQLFGAVAEDIGNPAVPVLGSKSVALTDRTVVFSEG